MRVTFRMPRALRDEVLVDLARPHPVATERVGFLLCGTALTPRGLLVLARDYLSVADDAYLPEPRVGAMVSASGFRPALQYAYGHRCSVWHVHCHTHAGPPGFSMTDRRESARFVPDFFKVRPELPHGALLLSRDSLCGLCWDTRGAAPSEVESLAIVGAPMLFRRASS